MILLSTIFIIEVTIVGKRSMSYISGADADFNDEGKGKSEFEFYESEDGKTVKDPPTLVAEPTKDNMTKYVVKDAAAAAAGGEGEDGGNGEQPADAAEGASTDAPTDAAAGGENVVTVTLKKVVKDFNIKIKGGAPEEGAENEDKIKQGIQAFCKEYCGETAAAVPGETTVPAGSTGPAAAGGGRRRSRRKHAKKSKKTKKASKRRRTRRASPKSSHRRSRNQKQH